MLKIYFNNTFERVFNTKSNPIYRQGPKFAKFF